MNSRIMKKFTVSLLTVLDYNDSCIRFKKELRGNIGKFLADTENKIVFLDVLKADSRLVFVVAEQMEGVTPDMVYRYVFDRFGAVHDVTSRVPAAIVRITGESVTDYKLFIDNEMVKDAL